MTDLPVACTLGPATLEARRSGLLEDLVRRADSEEELPDGRRLRFAAADGALGLIARTIDVERKCCRFLRFRMTVEPDEGPIVLELTGPDGTRDFLNALLDSSRDQHHGVRHGRVSGDRSVPSWHNPIHQKCLHST